VADPVATAPGSVLSVILMLSQRENPPEFEKPGGQRFPGLHSLTAESRGPFFIEIDPTIMKIKQTLTAKVCGDASLRVVAASYVVSVLKSFDPLAAFSWLRSSWYSGNPPFGRC
jgi:hypothetical protein